MQQQPLAGSNTAQWRTTALLSMQLKQLTQTCSSVSAAVAALTCADPSCRSTAAAGCRASKPDEPGRMEALLLPVSIAAMLLPEPGLQVISSSCYNAHVVG